MTVAENTQPINSSTANGVTTTFAYGFMVLDDEDITVAVNDAIVTTGYTITGVGDPGGGNVVFTTAPANGAKVVRYLDPAVERETDYQQFGDWLADEVNRDFDRIWLALQATNSRIDSALHVSQAGYQSGQNTELPAGQGGYALGWAADGVSLINILLSTGTTLVNLAASGGSSLIGFIAAGANAILRTLQAKVRERVSAADYSGYDSTGVTDSVGAVVSAMTMLGAGGGKVFINYGEKPLFDGNITIKKNCHLVGPHTITGSPGDNAAAAYGDLGGVIYLNSTATITLESGASISGLYIIRKGMTFPADDSSAYAGNAIAAGGDDTGLKNLMIIGFKKAYTVNGRARFSLERVHFDCDPSAGDGAIEVSAVHDSGQIVHCHGWPFGTIAAYSTATSGGTVNLAANAYRLHRTGNGIKISGQADDITMHGNLVYGYKKCFQLLNTGGFQFTGSNWGDGTTYYAGSIGFSFENCLDIAADQLRSYSTEKGFSFALGSENKFSANLLFVSACGSDAVTLDSGDFAIGTIWAKNCTGAAINITGNSARMRLENLLESGNTYANPIKLSVTNHRIEDVDVGGVISDKAIGTSLVGTNAMILYRIASAATLNIPLRPDMFEVTGTTSIVTINGGYGGRIITLMFESAGLTMTDNTGNLRLAGDFVVGVRSIITLLYDGVNSLWIEVSRSAN